MKRNDPSALRVFFQKFPRLLLAGAMYSAALAAFTALAVLAARLSGFYNIIVAGLGIIPSSVFLPGLVMVLRKYAVEKQFVSVPKTFWEAVRENGKAFLLHGVVIYLVTACAAFAFLYYGLGALVNTSYAMVFSLYMLFTCVLVIAMSYLVLMSVTYELRLRDLYKNALLMVFAALPRNLLALLYIFVIGAGVVSALLFTAGALRRVIIGFCVLLCPLVTGYGVTAIISKSMRENVGEFVGVADGEPKEASREEPTAPESLESDSDYVFVNGKMIKNPNKEAEK